MNGECCHIFNLILLRDYCVLDSDSLPRPSSATADYYVSHVIRELLVERRDFHPLVYRAVKLALTHKQPYYAFNAAPRNPRFNVLPISCGRNERR